MKYCTRCGKSLADDANFCGECGTRLDGYSQYSGYNTYNQNTNDQPQETATLAICALVFSFLWTIVGFVLGIIGCVKYKTPSYKKMSIAAIVISVISWVLAFALLSVMGEAAIEIIESVM